MKLVLGTTYTVLKADGKTVTFKFIGGETPSVEVNNEIIDLYLVLRGGYLSYWEN